MTASSHPRPDLVAIMKEWQDIENSAISSARRIIEKTRNPTARVIMEIIAHDSQMHHWVQDILADAAHQNPASVASDEFPQVRELIRSHIEIEEEAVAMAEKVIADLRDSDGMAVHAYLVDYLLADELKHKGLLSRLADIEPARTSSLNSGRRQSDIDGSGPLIPPSRDRELPAPGGGAGI